MDDEMMWEPIMDEKDLPKEDGYYLATVGSVGIDASETTCHELNWFKGKWYLPSDEMIEMGTVIAWMPKPEPYTPESRQFKCPTDGIFKAIGYDNPVFYADKVANCPKCGEKCWEIEQSTDHVESARG